MEPKELLCYVLLACTVKTEGTIFDAIFDKVNYLSIYGIYINLVVSLALSFRFSASLGLSKMLYIPTAGGC